MLKLIDNWQDKNLKCHFCGTTKSVKWEVSTNGVVFCTCGKCLLRQIEAGRTGEGKGEGVRQL